MPFVHIRILGPPLAPRQIETLQQEATRLMAELMRKQVDLTAVLVEEQTADYWSVGGVPVPAAAHLDVKVTVGTNSAEEKAAFIDQAHSLLKIVVGPDLPLATYVVVDELSADTWGYGGRTQHSRKPSVSQRT